MRLYLERAVGENATEIVHKRSYRTFTFLVKHEYPEAPCWEWIILDGSDPVEFGDARDEAGALEQLAAAVVLYCPELEEPDAPPENLLRVLVRRLSERVLRRD